MVRLVPAAAAAPVGDPAGLVGVRLRGAAVLGRRMGRAGFQRGRRVGEDHPHGEGREGGSGREDRGVERLRFVDECRGGGGGGGGGHRLARDGYLWFGLLHLHRRLGGRSRYLWVLPLHFDAQRGYCWDRIRIGVGVPDLTDWAVGLQDQLELVPLFL